MTSIREYRQPYKINGVFEYPQFFDEFKKAELSRWNPQEVSFESDIRDWQGASDDDRAIIGGILRGFTQLECHVSDYWANIPNWFPKHEIAAVARAFSVSEVTHAEAYNLLSDTLGLDEFEAFLGDPIARQKIDYFLNEKGIKESLAVFSGAGEGVSLFSSFAVLLSFNLTGKFKGVSQIISWSALDEQRHSDTGIALFKELVKEQGLLPAEAELIGAGFRAVVRNEDAFIDQIFQGRRAKSMDPNDLKQYIRWRANERITKLGISVPKFHVDDAAANRIKTWFHPIMAGATSTDFFAQSKDGNNYVSQPTQDYMAVNLKTLDLLLV
jgi:ribonucleoside-diphosphate reductase beta chain